MITRLLDEESEKRQELEKLKREQEQILKHEREMREGLEDQKEEKDQILLEAQAKLSELENERVEASEKLEVWLCIMSYKKPDQKIILFQTGRVSKIIKIYQNKFRSPLTCFSL